MRYAIIVVMGLLLPAACGSKPDAASSEGSARSPAGSAASKATIAQHKAAAELDDQLMDPPADVVEALGVEVFPGARVMKALKAMRSEASGRVLIDYVFFVKDAPRDIRDFYKAKLADSTLGDEMMEKAGSFIVKGKNTKGEEVSVQAQARGGMTSFHFVITKQG